MGESRVIYTDATTAEAITALKAIGYLETPEGGCFLDGSSPVRIYSVWGKALYYPELLEQVSFSPRIQIHFRCKEDLPALKETIKACVQRLFANSANMKFKAFNANTGQEITSTLT
jgi:hypothetical protein